MEQENVPRWNAEQFDLAWRNNECHMLGKGTAVLGTHPVKTSKQSSETQRPHAFSHTRNRDPTDQHMNKNTDNGGASPTWKKKRD
jgi:hypothetical protein